MGHCKLDFGVTFLPHRSCIFAISPRVSTPLPYGLMKRKAMTTICFTKTLIVQSNGLFGLDSLKETKLKASTYDDTIILGAQPRVLNGRKKWTGGCTNGRNNRLAAKVKAAVANKFRFAADILGYRCPSPALNRKKFCSRKTQRVKFCDLTVLIHSFSQKFNCSK